MSANEPTARRTGWPRLPLWRWVAAALALGVALGAGIALLHRSSRAQPALSTLPGRPAATWPARVQRAPGFRLADASGASISLGAFRGRPVIVTFIDPVCTTLCPLEAQQLKSALASVPAGRRPAILAVSVNPWAQSRAAYHRDATKWRLPPEWHWAAGRYAQLARVWKDYKIGVLDRTKTVDGITVHNVAHTEASYVIDADGYQRALFLYPFQGADVAAVLKTLNS
jgi:cytochrome oxidase Cu insertion factor (SCO1/SenC/PrrC family)